MGKWLFVLFIVISLIFAYTTKQSWNGILLFLILCIGKGVLNLVKGENE
jgi:hypothetical protein